MTESSDTEAVTLAGRLEDEARSVTGGDLELVCVFLYETLGNWYQLRPDRQPPTVELSNIVVASRAAADGARSNSALPLLDPGDVLEATATTDDPGESEGDGSGGDDGSGSGGEDSTGVEIEPDERDGVFAASETLAQVALGRRRTDDESWDDVIRQLEVDRRPALASALWVGLANQPKARYASMGQWRRSVDAALRSDAATATMYDEDDARSRIGPLVAAALVVVVVAAGAFLAFRGDGTTVEDAGAGTTEPAGPTTDDGEEDDSTTAGTPGSATSAAETAEEGSTTTRADAVDGVDECALIGPLGPVTVDQVSDDAIVVAWSPSTEAVNILLDGVFIDTVPPEAFRYVIEHLPLSDGALASDTDYMVAVESQAGEPSTACATTLANPVPGGEALIGVSAPTGLEIVDKSATSITVGWDLRPGADLHNLYLDGSYIQFGDVGGSSAIGDETEFTFIDLEPGTSYEIGIRRIEGPNQSGLASITATTDSD